MSAKSELIRLFNEIIEDENNDIEAVFVTLTSGEDEDVILFRNEIGGSIEIDAYAGLIADFTKLTNKLDNILDPQSGADKLGEASFRFKKGGTSITRLGEKNQVYLFFVTTGTNLAEMNVIRKRYMPEIKKLLQESKAIA